MRIFLSAFCFFSVALPAQEIVRTTDQFDFQYVVTFPEITKKARMWVPLAMSDRFQIVQQAKIDSPVNAKQLVEERFGNQILFLSLKPEHSGKKLTVNYRVHRRENSGYPATPNPLFLDPSRLVPLNAELRTLAIEAGGSTTDSASQAQALYWHTLERMRYDKSGKGWGRGDAMYACDARTGNCTDFHSYFIALARSLKIPARFAIGFTIPADRDAGAIAGYHCWAEYHAAGSWIPIDVSEADKHPELKHYYLGHHPANRFQFTIGRDLVVDPLPKSGPINFLVYPLLEVDGKEVKADCDFRFERRNQGARKLR